MPDGYNGRVVAVKEDVFTLQRPCCRNERGCVYVSRIYPKLSTVLELHTALFTLCSRKPVRQSSGC